MAIASDFLIGANDEHGLNPPTAGKRTPVLPYINRSFYENEFNRLAKLDFMLACLRCGFNVYDIKPELQDVSVSNRVVRSRRANVNLIVFGPIMTIAILFNLTPLNYSSIFIASTGQEF